MADSTDLERLVVALEAQSVKLDRAISATAANVDRQLGAMEKRTELMRQRMESSFANAGANSLKKFTNALLATGAFVAIERFVASVVNTAEGIKHTADAIGVGVEDLQAWSIAARHAGIDSDTFNTALERFSSNFGKAQLGNKQLRKEFVGLGVDLKGDVSSAFLQVANKIRDTNKQSEQGAIVTTLFGRGMGNLVNFMSQGSDKINQFTADMKASGRVISAEGIAKIDEMKQKWEDLKQRLTVVGANAIVGFADEFGKFVDQMDSPEFQSALANFGRIMADVAVFVSKIADMLPGIAGALIGLKIGGPLGALIGLMVGGQLTNQPGAVNTGDTIKELEVRVAALKRELDPRGKSFNDTVVDSIFGTSEKTRKKQAELAALQAQLKSLKEEAAVTPTAKPDKGGKPPPSDLFGPDVTSRLAAEAQARADAYARLRVEQARANEQQVAADDQLHVTLLKGLAGYHDAVVQEIDDELAAKLKQIEEERQAKITALGKEKGLLGQQLQDQLDAINETAAAQRSAAEASAETRQFQAGSGALAQESRIQAAAQIKQYEDETKALGLLGGALAEAEFWQTRENAAIAQGLSKESVYTDENKALAAAIRDRAQALHEATRAMQDDIAVADQFRTGLEDVLASGLHGFKSLKDAAKSFLDTMAETILKTYVLKPLLENLFGEQGTPLGGIIGSLFGAASGTGKPTGQETDPVWVNVKNGGTGTGGTGNPIADLIKDIGQTGGPNLSNNPSLPFTVEGGTTGASDPAEILADGFQQGSKDISAAITDSGGDVASGLTGALKDGGNFLSDILGSAFKAGGDLLSTIFNSLGSLLGGGGSGGGLGGILGSLLGGGGGDIFGGLGSLLGIAGESSAAGFGADALATGGLIFLADGGVMTNKGPLKLRKYAGGGVANSPQLAMYGEGSGPEAYVPLKGGAIPVHITMPVAKTQPIVNVYQTVHADRSILADDVFRKIEKSKNEAIDIGSRSGAALALRAQPGRQEQFRKLGT